MTNTPRLGLNRFEPGDKPWDHADLVDWVDEHGIDSGTLADRPASGEYDDELYLALDQRILWRWDADANDWAAVAGLGSEGDPLPESLWSADRIIALGSDGSLMSEQDGKVIGEIDAEDVAGLVGVNLSETGEVIGVYGETESDEGYGLYTPDDAHVGGTVEADEADVGTVNTERAEFNKVHASEGPDAVTETLEYGDTLVQGDGEFEWAKPVEVPSNTTLKFEDTVTIVPAETLEYATLYHDAHVTDVSCFVTNKNGEHGDFNIKVIGGEFDWKDSNPNDAHTGAVFIQNSRNCTVRGMDVRNMNNESETNDVRHHAGVFSDTTDCFFIDCFAEDLGREGWTMRGVVEGVNFIRCEANNPDSTGGASGTHGFHSAGWPGTSGGGFNRFYAERCITDNNIYLHNGTNSPLDGKNNQVINCEADEVATSESLRSLQIIGGRVDEINFGGNDGDEIDYLYIGDGLEQNKGADSNQVRGPITIHRLVFEGVRVRKEFAIDLDTSSPGATIDHLFMKDVELDVTGGWSRSGLVWVRDNSDISKCTIKNSSIDGYDDTAGGFRVDGTIDDAVYRNNTHRGSDIQLRVSDTGTINRVDHLNNDGIDDARDDEPTDPHEGQVYLDDGTNRADSSIGYRYFNGTSWEDIADTS